MEESRALPQVFTAPPCGEVENTDAGDSWAARLPARCRGGVSALDDTAATEAAFEGALLPERRLLGHQTTEFPALVQDVTGGWISGAQRNSLWCRN